jgi:hypothetical protein
MRSLNKFTSELEVNTGNSGEAHIEVPCFGVLLVGQITSTELIDRLTPQWRAMLVQPDSKGNFSQESKHIEFQPRVVDNRVEIELLYKADRLTVVLMLEKEDVNE